jgi:hypothetical protein
VRLHASAAAPGDPLEKLDAAALADPTNAPLWQALVELLKRLDRGDEASAKLRRARELGCPDSPEIRVLEALDAAYHGDPQASLQRFDALLSQFPEDPYVLRNFAMQLLKNRDAERAASVCEAARAHLPFDQTLLAYQSTAWQLLGDAREHWLCDYQNMVVPVPVPVPEGFAGREEFFAAVTEALERLHHSRAQPIEQSVRGGTQTNGFLFRLKEPLLAVLENQIREAIVSALMTFPDDARHPFWGRRHKNPRGDGLRFSGAWSVRLRDQGFHSNHIHPEGWISSALYIALPEEVEQGKGTEGHIQFGTPMRELGLELPPRRVVKPEVGTLVLFPSYMWHGTLPFHSDQSRITVAFDLLPEA